MENMILYPVFASAFLTFGIGIWLAKLRFVAVQKGDLNPRYYELNRGGKLPEYLAKVNNNYDNLLSLPILFYVVSILMLITAKIEISQIILAWLFVASRYVHSYIHTTYNNVRHGRIAFIFGIITLFGMWTMFLSPLCNHNLTKNSSRPLTAQFFFKGYFLSKFSVFAEFILYLPAATEFGVIF